jgi:uncharacterized Zn finger protein (UPF0148 family)
MPAWPGAEPSPSFSPVLPRQGPPQGTKGPPEKGIDSVSMVHIARERELDCPNCHHPVTVDVEDGKFVCPNCGFHGSVGGSEKEGSRMGTHADVGRLLTAASKASTLVEQQRLVGEAEELRTSLARSAAASNEVDLSRAVVRDTLTPVRVHEHHTAATDWLGSLDTAADGEHEMLAQASLWYGRTAAIRGHRGEFNEQAHGMARRLAGAYGSNAAQAEAAFLGQVRDLYLRDARAGLITEAASGVPQIGEPGAPVAEATVGPPGASGLPLEYTTSERAPVIQALENNSTVGGDPATSDPSVLPQADPDVANGDVGTRRNFDTVTASRRTAASGLDQIQEIKDAQDNQKTTPLPEEVAFPWEMDAADQGNAIAETEQQLAQRQKLVERARMAARHAYLHVLAGQDDSGWLGDMGAAGNTPGEQDGGNPGPPSNLGQPDPVYGQGGDNPNQPLKPYGADEADDYTNNPGQNYSPGQPLQMDQGGRGQSVASLNQDPEIQRALAFIRHRRAYLQSR